MIHVQIMNSFKNLSFSLNMFAYISAQYYALTRLCYWLFNKVDLIYTEMSDFKFYALLIIAGLIAVSVLDVIIVRISFFCILKINKTLPDLRYAVLFTKIYSVGFCAFLLMFLFSDTDSMKKMVVFLSMAIVLIRVAYLNIMITKTDLEIKYHAIKLGISEQEIRKLVKQARQDRKRSDLIIRNIKNKVHEISKKDIDF